VRHFLLAATFLFGTQPAQPADDFAFRFEAKGCHYETIDTFRGTYSRYVVEPFPLTLSGEEKAVIFQAITASGFFELSTTVNPPLLSDGSIDWSDIYEIEVRNASGRHTISWRVSAEWSSADEGRRIVQLVRTIQKVIGGHPDVQRLGPTGDGCIGRDSKGGR